MNTLVQRVLAAALGIVLVTGMAAGQESVTDAPIAVIQASELASRIEAGTAPVILDVRTPEEFEDGHVPGAINVPYTELSDRLPDLGLDPAAELVVYCRTGRRAAIAETALSEAGFTSLRDLDGHITSWGESGLPLE